MKPPGLPRGSLAIAAISTVVEWYDFTLYLYFATVLSGLFYPGHGSLLTTLASFALAYLMRPIGAVVFGHFGDRFGRRRAMLFSMTLMTVCMFATAVLPTAAEIGPAAGVLLLFVRCVMGFSVGGEYTGVVTYLLEGAAIERRGLVTSMAAATSEIGALMAVAVAAITVELVPAPELTGWGWRIPFVFGAALAASILLARTFMAESPEFDAQSAEGTIPEKPLRYSLTHDRAGIARGFAISALGSITYYVGITYVPTFLTSIAGFGETRALGLATFAAIAVILVTPLTGMISDRWGRRPVLLMLALASVVLPITMFRLMADGSLVAAYIGALVLAALAGGVSAVGAVTSAELFTGEARMSGLAFGVTTATALFGGVAPWAAQGLIALTGSLWVPGAFIAVVALGVLPVFLAMPETRPKFG